MTITTLNMNYSADFIREWHRKAGGAKATEIPTSHTSSGAIITLETSEVQPYIVSGTNANYIKALGIRPGVVSFVLEFAVTGTTAISTFEILDTKVSSMRIQWVHL